MIASKTCVNSYFNMLGFDVGEYKNQRLINGLVARDDGTVYRSGISFCWFWILSCLRKKTLNRGYKLRLCTINARAELGIHPCSLVWLISLQVDLLVQWSQ